MIKELQKINKILVIALIMTLFFSFFFIEKNDKLYHCVSVFVNDDSTTFYLAMFEDEKDLVLKDVSIKGNDYQLSLERSKEYGIDIEMTVLKSVIFSKKIRKENFNKFLHYAKDNYDLSTATFYCDEETLQKKDSFDNECIIAINESFLNGDGIATLFDLITKRKEPKTIIFDGEKFIETE